MKNLNLNTILLIGVAVLLTLQIQSCFSKSPVSEDIVRAKVENEILKKELPIIRAEKVEIEAKYDSLLAASFLRESSIELRKEPIRYAIKQVPIIVSNFDREQLRRSYTDY